MFLSSLLAEEWSWYIFDFSSPKSAVIALAVWLALAMLVTFVVLNFIVKENRAKFYKISAISALGVAAVIILLFVIFDFIDDGIKPLIFFPLLATAVSFVACAVAVLVKPSKTTNIVCLCVCAALVLVSLICIGVNYAFGSALEDNWLEADQVQTIGLYVSAVLLAALIVVLGFVLDKGHKKETSSKSIAYAGVCIALSFALSYLRIAKMPQGGSITVASLLPLMVYAFMFGTKKGIFAGMIYGVMQAVQDTYILHPAQFLLDYPVAFAAIGLAGAFANVKSLEKLPQVQFALGAIVAGVGRFVSHLLSGIFAFGAFAPEGQSAFTYSLIYQSSYVFPDLLIVIVAGVIVFSAKSFTSQVRKIQASNLIASSSSAQEV